ncbi:alanine--tRNA ligase [Candidatus Woesearchaeota archaeon]|nr:alanine--tRNA ligase [Candidatus Woesearchaeota archaeon]
MLPDKEIKKKYKPIFWKNPEKYYATQVLKEEGFARAFCKKCKKPFWSTVQREVCGDPACSGEGFAFIGKSPAGNTLAYVDIWKKFSSMFERFGYTPIKRYPTVARWNPTMEYTNASIAAFQPYVISGEVEPPANPLVIPQVCLRFADTDNVGITMSHNTGFVMIGQHMFVAPEKWNQNEVFRHMLQWNLKGLGLQKKDMAFHEDAWAGGGNLGCCMEMFSKGCELWNQVYMLYEQTPSGVKDLKIKVLDMGLGMERNAWFAQGAPTIYDATFPHVLKKLRSSTGVSYDEKTLQKYTPYASLLNNDETEDMDKAWKTVASHMKMDVKALKEFMLPSAGLYSVAEHMRSILFVLNDGGLPSNVGGGYNLRMLLRRSFGFIDKYHWDVDVKEVVEWHAEDLKKMYPELRENLADVHKILDAEKIKYENTKQKTQKIIAGLKEVKMQDLITLYDSQGISPDMIPGVKAPDDFYARVSERHEQKEQKAATHKTEVAVGNVQDTKALYFEDYKLTRFKGKVLKIKGDVVILDQTAFYPTSGGQLHDLGTLQGCAVEEVWKQGALILHRVKNISFKEGDAVEGKIDRERRIQMAQHHTSTHIINAAAKRVLGRHVNQAGAFKDVDKARIDITHFESLTEEEVEKIEKEANAIVSQSIPIEKKFYSRNEAEQKFGMEIYQGGAVPGKLLRIVNIKGVDVEACGGTHLDNTKEAELIKIIKTTKVQDGVIRLVFAAGKAAREEVKESADVLAEIAQLLHCTKEQVPGRAEELFTLWKDVVKKKKNASRKLVSLSVYHGDVLAETARMLKTQPEHVLKTVERFLKEIGM